MRQRFCSRRTVKILLILLGLAVAVTTCSTIAQIAENEPGIILFVSKQDGPPEIYRIDTDGSHLKRLTYSEWGSILPRWSPDGKHIAFLSGKDKQTDLYVMDADGAHQKRLTTSGEYRSVPQWWPDSQHISLFSRRTFQTLNIDGSTPQSLFDVDIEPYNGPPLPAVLSPDGSYIAAQNYIGVSGEYHPATVTFLKSDGTQARSFKIINFSDLDEGAWSPDSAHILYTMIQGKGVQVRMMHRDGSSPTFGVWGSLVPVGQEYRVWSPNGKYIAAACCVFLGPQGPARSITIVAVSDLDNTTQSRAERLTTVEILPDDPNKRGLFDPPVYLSGFSWAPDSRQLVFTFNAGRYELAVMNVDGSGRNSILVRDTWLDDPHWSPIRSP